MKKLLITIAAFALVAAAPVRADNEVQAASLSELLQMVKDGKLINQDVNAQRETEFARNRANQAQELSNAQRLQREEEARSERLETEFERNEARIAEQQEILAKRLGSLRELFGVLQQVSGDTQGVFEGSIVSAEYPGRTEWLSEFAQSMGSSSKLASIEEIERLWFEIQREMTETGKITRFTAPVNKLNGEVSEQEIVRIGAYNLVSEGQYVVFDIDNNVIKELPAQPESRFVSSAAELQAATSGFTAFGLDPTRGQLLELQIQIPTIEERINQGGTVGYIIIALGIVALLMSIERFITLTLTAGKVKAQIKNSTANTGNTGSCTKGV